MKYIFVLGRNPELSEIEVETYLNVRNIPYKIVDKSKNFLILELDKLPPINDFGGIIRIAKVVSETDDVEEIEYYLNQIEVYEGEKNKVYYSVTALNSKLESFVKEYLKERFKKEKLKAFFKKADSPSDLIRKDCIEFIVYRNFIAKTIAVSNPLELKERDIKRPETDFLNTISLRLAKIMVNMSGAKKGDVLLDPFCGSGSVLQEALLLGIDVVGIDHDKEMIKKCGKNMEWLTQKFKIKPNYRLFLLDCKELTKVIKKNSIDVVVTEPYMGPFIKALPNRSAAEKTIKDLYGLYTTLFIELSKVVKKDGKVVIITPTIVTRDKQMRGIDVKKVIGSEFKVLEQVFYKNPENRLIRHICVISKI